MKKRPISWLMVFAVSTALIGCASAAKDPQGLEEAGVPTGAKAIFDSGYGPKVTMNTASPEPPQRKAAAQKPEKEMYMGVSYWVELVGKDGQMQRVTTSRTFQGGERIRLYLTSNRSGYLYLINKGSTGRSSILFPYGGKDNYVQAHTPYTVPHGAQIRFDENPGEEILWVMLSPYPFGNKDAPASSTGGSGQFTTALYQRGCKDLVLDNSDHLLRVGEKCGAKDLVLEEDTVSSQPAGYGVAPLSSVQQDGQIISLQIKLRHR